MHGAYFSNASAYQADPFHCLPSAQTLWAVVGQDILNADVGGYFQGQYITSGLFNLWRSQGLVDPSLLPWPQDLLSRSCQILIFSGFSGSPLLNMSLPTGSVFLGIIIGHHIFLGCALIVGGILGQFYLVRYSILSRSQLWPLSSRCSLSNAQPSAGLALAGSSSKLRYSCIST
jgi:hypothetical protein